MDISVVVPFYNEEESLNELANWIKEVVEKNGFSWEVLFIDDGSNDDSWNVFEQISENDEHFKGIKFRRNYGKSAALNEGFKAARGDVVITMDADLQDSPEEIPELYYMIKKEVFDLVSGCKKKRHDPIGKRLPSKFFNMTTRKLSGIKLHDFNCGLKAYSNAVVKNIEVYGEMHRYIPVIAKWAGFNNIGEKVVRHQKRKFGISKFGMERIIKGYLDLLSITFISKFGKRPMHLFGALGTILFFFGFLVGAYLTVAKFIFDVYRMTDRPLFYFGMLAMVIGTQLFLTGFLAEMVSRSSYERNIYQIEKKTGLNEDD